MRTVTVGMVPLLLVAIARGEYTLSLVEHDSGLSTVCAAPGTFTLDLNLVSDGRPSSYGETTYIGAQTALAALPTDWAVSNATFNTVDFEAYTIMGSNPIFPVAIARLPVGTAWTGYTTSKTLLSFTVVASGPGTLALKDAQTAVCDSLYNTVYVGPGDLVTVSFTLVPEPATLMFLAFGGLTLRRARRQSLQGSGLCEP